MYREGLAPLEGHPPAPLLRSPPLPLLVVPDHRALVQAGVVMQSDPGGVDQVHVEPDGQTGRGRSKVGLKGHHRSRDVPGGSISRPGGVGINGPLDGDGPARTEAATDDVAVGNSLEERDGRSGRVWRIISGERSEVTNSKSGFTSPLTKKSTSPNQHPIINHTRCIKISRRPV